MIGFLKFLAVILLPAAGYALRKWVPQIGLLVNQWLPLGLLGLWLVVGITGIFAGPEAPHRTLAQTAVVVVWLVAPLGVGIFFYGAFTGGTARSWVGVGAPLLALVVVLLTAVTGYTGPTRAAAGAQHTLRFEILHLFATPALAAAILMGWALLARRDLKEGG